MLELRRSLENSNKPLPANARMLRRADQDYPA
jgi:hypothetical protein